jgi:hypothetical protein
MKLLIFFLIFIIPQITFAQKVIVLSVNQPPEFGFSVNKTDTTIVKGATIELGNGLEVFGGTGGYNYHWEPNATLSDSSILYPLASPLDTTAYILTVTDENGCSFSVGYTVNVREKAVNAPVETQSQSLQAVLFPNPNDGKFKVRITGLPVEKIDLTIFDNTGKLVKRQTIHNFTGNHTETLQLILVSGIYTLHIYSGKEALSRQFIIN